MAQDKKKEAEKTIPKRKASVGAWWKSTVVEETEQPKIEKAETTTEAAPAEIKEKKAAPKRTPRKKTASPKPTSVAPTKSDDKTDQADSKVEKSVASPKASPKRAPRRKKEPVATSVTSDVSTQGVAESDVTDSATTPKKQPRKRPTRKKKVVEEVGGKQDSEESKTVALTDGALAEKESSGTSVVDEQDSAPIKRTPRKRQPRKKKTEVVAEEATAVDRATETSPTEDDSAEKPEVAEPPKKSPRRRSPRKKKSVEKVAEEVVKSQEVKTETETSTAEPEAGAATETVETQEPSQATESSEAADKPAQEAKKRRSATQRSRGRRKSTPKKAEVSESSEQLSEEGGDQTEAVNDTSANGVDSQDLASQEKRDEQPREAVSQDRVTDEIDEEQENLVLKLLINAEEPEECRLALLENGRLESIHVSTINRTQTKNNIYKARIVAIEPNLQAAFIDYGTEKNGFLPFSEIHPEYYKEELSEDIQKLVDAHHWKKLSILDVMEKGQDVMVQVVKEEVGKKGANMTTYLSLPGRSVVLMPGSDSSGISRKISGEERRSQLRKAMTTLGIPEGIGWIVRTAGVDITTTALTRDVGYLLRLWEEIKKKAQGMDGVGQIYEDHQSVLRFLREHFDPAIEEILVDDEGAMNQVREFVSLLPSKHRNVKVRLHKGSRPIFNQYSIEDQIESIYQPRVNLPSGGSIIIEPTEALVSIDVNSGSTSKGKNFDQSIYQANLEAASELARQLRLRDLGGLIIVDFIDMRNKKHIRDVERMVKTSMKRDKAKVDLSRISKFGLMQISRQKLGSPIEAGNYRVCQHCKGRGTVRSVETLALFYLRRIQTGASRKHVGRVECHFPLDVAQYLLNKKRHEILDHETRYDTEITIIADPGMSPADHEITLHKAEKDQNDKKQG